jgi:Phage tail tube protein
MALSLEAVMGTYQPPTTAGTVWIPILSENLQYREDKYYSPQIRQQTIVSSSEQSYYHVEGDIRLEVDPQFMPYLYYCSRHNITKTGASAPFTYKFALGTQGSASTAASGAVARTASITIVRNGIGFGYAGCVFGGYEITVENGVLVATMNALGLSEIVPSALGTPAWVAPDLFGAAAHAVQLDASGTTPAFASTDVNHNGFTFTANFNASAQNRVRRDRSASYISYGESEITYTTELDFMDRTQYDAMVANTFQAFRFESIRGAATFALAPEAHRITIRKTSYDTYEVGLAGIGDLIMAGVTGRVIGITGADAYDIEVKSSASIT